MRADREIRANRAGSGEDAKCTWRLPASLGRYTLRRHLGHGGMGEVFEAVDERSGRRVAIKTLLTAASIRRLKDEFRTVADLRHVNLAAMYELACVDGVWFIAMELVDGQPFGLRMALTSGTALELAQLRILLRQLATGLAYLHGHGLVHGDIKPANVLVTNEGRVAILDFGLTRTAGVDPSGAPTGFTPAYSAPELLTTDLCSCASDMYSVGRMLSDLLGPHAQASRGGVHDLVRLCEALLSSVPTERPTAQQMLEWLDRHSRLEPATTVAFVGRKDELSELARWWERCLSGATVCAVLIGDSGIGKTTLVEAFIERARQLTPEVLVLGGRCHERESIPFRGFDRLVDLLTPLLVRDDAVDDDARAALREVAPLFPSVRQALGDVDSDCAWESDPLETRRRAFSGLRQCLNALGARRPLLLWLDDLHWADADSWALLAGILEGPDLPRCLMLLTHRSDPRLTAPLEAWMQRAVTSPHLQIERLAIGPLPKVDADCLARAAGWTEEASQLAVEASGGNPFLLERIIERGPSDARQPEELLRRSILDQESEISPDALRLLTHLALAGQPLKLETAMRAAALARSADDILSTLLSLRLVRHAVVAGGDWLELRHDRFREQILSGLTSEEKQAAHLRLARAMEADACDGAAVACHYAEGLDTRRASRLAEQASRQLAESFAFAQAADLLIKALEWDGTDPRRARSLRLQQAEAFANAGNGPAAAQALLLAAEMTDGLNAIDLRRRAAEQFLGSGHLAEGNALIRPLCCDHGIPYPRQGRQPLMRNLLMLAWLRCRSTRLRVGGGRPVSANDSLRIELCWTAAKGLMAFDPTRGLYFLLRGLLVALRTENTNQAARFMALLAGTFLVPGPAWLARWGERLLAQAEQAAAELRDPHVRALVLICRGHALLQEGHWQETVAACDEGDEIARTRCIGVDWERTVSSMGTLRALEELGRFREIGRRTQLALPDVRRRSDAYAETTNLLYLAIALIAAGEVPEARRIALELRAQWSGKSRLHVQYFYALRIELHCDLAERKPEVGLGKLNELWPMLRRSGFLYSPLVRTDAFCLRGRLALATAQRLGAAASIDEVDRAIQILEALSRPSASARAALLRAGRARLLGQTEEIVPAVKAAARGFEGTGSRALVLACEYCLAQENPSTEEGASGERSLQLLANLGVLDPCVWLRVELPVLADSSPRLVEKDDTRPETKVRLGSRLLPWVQTHLDV